MATVWTLQLHHHHLRPPFFPRQHHSRNLLEFPMQVQGRIIATVFGRWTPDSAPTPNFVLRAFTQPVTNSSADASDPNKRISVPDEVFTAVNTLDHRPHRHRNGNTPTITLNKSQTPTFQLQHTVASFPPFIFSMKRYFTTSFTVGLCAAATLLLIVIRSYTTRKSRYSRPGSVADLVRRGQLRSDRRGISTPLKYDDPFNNPMVKVGKSNSTVEMCGKVYRLAPVTLTKEQAAIHQKRRSRAYQWKRPKVFLKEGDSIPPDVDPDTVRWIPANHPFATTASDIDEDLAQNNVYQKHGVPFRIQAEHEALQSKLEALQNEQKLDKLVIDPGAAKDFERPFKPHLKSENQMEKGPSNRQMGLKNSNSDSVHNPTLNRQAAEEMENP